MKKISSYLTRPTICSCKLCCLSDTQDIHSIYLLINVGRAECKWTIQIHLTFIVVLKNGIQGLILGKGSATKPHLLPSHSTFNVLFRHTVTKLEHLADRVWFCLYNKEPYPQSRNKISSFVVICAGRCSLDRCPHAIAVILTDENTR